MKTPIKPKSKKMHHHAWAAAGVAIRCNLGDHVSKYVVIFDRYSNKRGALLQRFVICVECVAELAKAATGIKR